MKKKVRPLLLSLALALTLTACGRDESPEIPAGPGTVSAPERSAAGSQSAPPEEADDGLTPLTEEEVAAAHEAAYRYYEDTVFEVQTLTEIQPREGEVSFQVTCSKGGVPQEPDRTISLERRDGVWTVINEGY